MASTKLVYRAHPTPSDPQLKPVLIIGQVKHLAQLKYDDIKCKLMPRVSEEVKTIFFKFIHYAY